MLNFSLSSIAKGPDADLHQNYAVKVKCTWL